MKRKIVLRLSFLTVLLTLLWSCRNEDLVQADKNPLRNNADFFTHAKNGGANAKSGVDYIDILQAYNRETNFLLQMPDQKGMPIWEKMQIVDAEGATGLMIPLSHDNETMSSVLFVTLDDKNSVIGVKDYDNSLLEKIVYDEKINRDFREQMFYTFMFVDNRTFGNEEFTHIPKDLFIGSKRRNEEYGRMKFTDFKTSPAITTQQNGKVLIIETCAVTWHCTHHGGGGPCDYCSECYGTVCSTTMISVADDPFPGTSGSSGGGGGGLPPSGPEGNIPSGDPCGASTSVFYRLAPGCGGGNTDIPDLEDPCSKTQNLLAQPEVDEKIQILKEKAEKPKANEFGFKARPDGTTSDLIEGERAKIDFGDMHGFTSFYHSHPGLAGINIFSPPDIQSLFKAIITAGNSSNFKDISFGVIGSEACSCPGGVKYFHYIIYYNGQFSDTGAIASTDYDMETINVDYENKQAEIVDTYPDCTDNGSSLNHKGVERLFFDTLGKMNIIKSNVILQRIDNDGTVYTITPNNDGTTTAKPCL